MPDEQEPHNVVEEELTKLNGSVSAPDERAANFTEAETMLQTFAKRGFLKEADDSSRYGKGGIGKVRL